MSKKEGFTLIELMISISIIAILSAIGMVTYSTVMKQGRDSKRQADLRSIQSAVEQYYADQLVYPVSLPAVGSPLKSPDNSKTYLNQIPGDPSPSRTYYYFLSGTSYCLYGQLENITSPELNGCAAHPPHNFAVTPP